MCENGVAGRFDETPVPLGSWAAVRESKVEKVKVFPPIKVRVVDVVVVRRFMFSRRGNGRNITSDIERRRQAKEPLWNEATALAGDAEHVVGVVQEVEVANGRRSRRVARGRGSRRRGDRVQGRGW